jgi:hypothetical protein
MIQKGLFYKTRFAIISLWTARLILVSMVVLVVWGVICPPELLKISQSQSTGMGGDSDLYHSIIQRIKAGENYYQVAGDELRNRGYATKPVFNWRLPFLAWIMGSFPSLFWSKAILFILALTGLLLWVSLLAVEGIPQLVLYLAIFLLCGPMACSISNASIVYHELWAGICISLSLAAHGRKLWFLYGFFGILALFIRELSLIYVGVMLVMAWHEGRYRELTFWLIGLVTYTIIFGIHLKIVSNLQSEMDRAANWIALGGWSFVLSTAIWNLPLLFAPAWVVAVLVPLALLGLAGWRGATGSRVALTVGAFVIAFLIVGRPDNLYWGLMYAPLLPLGWIQLLPVVPDLFRTALRKADGVRQL